MNAPADSFDYIVVGAGCAGCVLANRLTASGRHRVLLLEAGGDDRHLWIHIPLGYGKLFADASVNWLYTIRAGARAATTADHPAARQGAGRLELDQRPALHPRPARGLRSLAPARQRRLELRGRAALLPPRRAPGARRGRLCTASAGRSRSPTCASRIRCARPSSKRRSRRGSPRNDDFNGPTQEGAGYFQLTARNGRRWSTAVGYLRPARRRRNLAVVTDALATRILFEGRRAVGVEYLHGGDDAASRAPAAR